MRVISIVKFCAILTQIPAKMYLLIYYSVLTNKDL